MKKNTWKFLSMYKIEVLSMYKIDLDRNRHSPKMYKNATSIVIPDPSPTVLVEEGDHYVPDARTVEYTPDSGGDDCTHECTNDYEDWRNIPIDSVMVQCTFCTEAECVARNTQTPGCTNSGCMRAVHICHGCKQKSHHGRRMRCRRCRQGYYRPITRATSY